MRQELFIFAILLALADIALADVAYAGRYEIVKGKGVDVCEAYRKNLNSFNLHEPMICERQISPEMKDFQKPEWKELDAWENRQLVRKINRFLGIGMAEDWENSLKWDIEHRHLVMYLSQIDIDNDGQRENMLKFAEGSCPMTRQYGTSLLVLSEDKKDIDIKTVPLMQNTKVVPGGPISEGWEFSMYDIFLYRSKIYFDRWSQSQDQTGFLKVFVTEKDIVTSGITKEVCRYQFKSGK